jgi:hypothetical protein
MLRPFAFAPLAGVLPQRAGGQPGGFQPQLPRRLGRATMKGEAGLREEEVLAG